MNTLSIRTIASSSKGNCYIIDDGNTPIMIECGLPIKKIKKELNHNVNQVHFCLVSHSHNDHSKSINDLIPIGIDVYASKETFQKKDIEIGSRTKIVKQLKQFKHGSWTILPFDTVHYDSKDVQCEGSLGFLLQSSASGSKILFATDTAYIKYKFKGLTHIMVESNYQIDILNRNIENGSIHPTQKDRLLKSHFGLDNVVEFIKSNDMTNVSEIHLLHLSAGNSNAELMSDEIAGLTGKPVYIASE